MIAKNINKNRLSVVAVVFGFFVMGFVDMVGVATNYIRTDFNLSNSLSNIIPMMVFLWFAVFSIPAGMLMGKIGKKKTVLLSMSITTIAMILPYLFYSFSILLLAFALLGIANTILQVSLNPLVATLFDKSKTASVLTAGQFVKAISSLMGPIVTGLAVRWFSDWRVAFIFFAIVSFISSLLLINSEIKEGEFSSSQSTFREVLAVIKDKYVLYCFLAVLFIVGLDVGINTVAPALLMERTGLELSSAGLGSSVYFAAKTLGAFLGAILLLRISSLRFLKTSLILAIASLILLIFVQRIWLLVAFISLIGLFCANVFSIVFSLALKRNKEKSNEISALMIMGVSGGAIILPIQGVVNDALGLSAALSVLLACLIVVLLLTKNIKENEA